MFALNIFIFVVTLTCFASIVWIYKLVGGRGRLVLGAAFIYGAALRGIIAFDLCSVEAISNAMIVFWVLLTAGLWMLVIEIKRTLKG